MIYKFKEYKAPEILNNHLNLGGYDNKGNEIAVTSLYITENGKPVMYIMGELHFSRLPRSMWMESLKKMKAGGIDVVSTYVIWIYHESEEGVFDFADGRDLRAFIEMAAELGLKVCIRIGPWCHGEVRNGGFPEWLLGKSFKLRDDNDEYLALVRGWYSAIAEQLSGLLFKDGGPIIMCQLENELIDNAEHLLTLKHLAIECGIEVPIYTVTGWNAVNGARIPVDDVLPTFGGYCDAPWDEGTDQLPPCPRYYFTGIRNDSAIGKDIIVSTDDDWQLPYDRYPNATCEIGGGLMNTYQRRYQIYGMDVYAMTLVMLCEGVNLPGYYMYHGAVNKLHPDYTLQESKATGYPNDYPMLSYDFQAPISCYGETRESYDLLNMLHLFIHEYGSRLAQMTYVEAEKVTNVGDMKSLRYGVRRDEHSGFVFINHYQRLHKLEDIENVEIDTGEVRFPAISVRGDLGFFMPFNMDLGDGVILKYATAQPLCKDGDVWYFLRIPGIDPQMEFADEGTLDLVNTDSISLDSNSLSNTDKRIVLLDIDEAKRLRKVDGRVYFDDIKGKTNTDLANAVADGYRLIKLEKEAFEIPDMFRCELEYGNGIISWYRLELTDDNTEDDYINIDLKCDVMQLYVDRNFIDDDFYHGLPWRIPKSILTGKDIHVVASVYREGLYIEL